jgi:hypothetical protein
MARYYLVRSLSTSGKHLSQMETFIEKIPARLSSTAGSVTSSVANLPVIGSVSGAGNPVNISSVSGTTGSISSITVAGATPGTDSTSDSLASTASSAVLATNSLTLSPGEPSSKSASLNIVNLPAADGSAIGLPIDSSLGSLTFPTSPDSSDTTKLKPAEIAFLIRGGDLNHTIIVLAVDLIQRSIKTQSSSFADGLADYEKSMWRIVSRSVKDWATQKVQQTLVSGAKNPVAAARRIVYLYNFIRNSLRGLITDTIADPRQLKKYFSPGGVIRIMIDFTSAGYKLTFEQELRKSLLRRGLLVPETVREEVGKRFFVIGVLGLIATLAAALCFLPGIHVAMVAWTAALVAGFSARTLLALRHLVPFYEEIAVVVSQIRRKSFRLTIVKILLRSINVASWLALLFSLVFTLGFGSLFLLQAMPTAGWPEIGGLFALTIANFAIADFLFNGVKLNIQECPTRIADQQLGQMREELENVSPLECFRTMLASPNYDPTFSKILALYGIETLLVLI